MTEKVKTFKRAEDSLSGGNETGRLASVANTALIGVPAAYTVSQSVPVTLVTAVVAISLACLALRGR